MDSVSSVSRPPVACSTVPVNSQAQNSSLAQQATRVSVSRAQTADITIVTKEGDTVTLSASRTADLSFSTYNAQGQIGGKAVSVSAMSAELHRTSDFSITVDGDLNREEMKEIRRAIRIIEKSAHDVLTGHADKAAARTAKLADLDQLQSVDADIECKQEVSVTQLSSQTAAVPDATDSAAPTTDAAVPSPAAPETPASQPEVPADASAAPAAVPAVPTDAPKSHLTVLGPSLTGAPLFSSSLNSSWIPIASLLHRLQSINGQASTSKAQPDLPAANKA